MRDPFLQNLWRNSIGLPDLAPAAIPPLESLRESEWSPAFERLMRNRLIMGRFRYSPLGNVADKPQYDRMASIEKRTQQYKATGNDELLVDIANLCLLEFCKGRHPAKHFHAIDDGEHVARKGDPQ